MQSHKSLALIKHWFIWV